MTEVADNPGVPEWANHTKWVKAVEEKIGPHAYQWTGRSPDTCAVTDPTGAEVWCGLPEDHTIHQGLAVQEFDNPVPEFAHVVLKPDEFVLLKPKGERPMSYEEYDNLANLIPESLRDRVLIIDPSVDVVIGSKPEPGSSVTPCAACSQPAQFLRRSQFTGPGGIPFCRDHAAQEKRHAAERGEEREVSWEEIGE